MEFAGDVALGVVTLGMSVPLTAMDEYLCPECRRDILRKGKDPDDWQWDKYDE